MQGLYTEIHNEKEIVVIDYSIVPHELEFDLMKYSLEYITKYERTSALVLEIISRVKLKQEILDYFPQYFDEIKGHVKRWGSVGFGKLIFKEMIDTKLITPRPGENRNIDWFETKEEALEFLIQDYQ
ncbi:hypothetical protein SAMN05421640_3142 [Ekhidna lutea]|uniref:Uncharacterized protein n=1 Tax=Ekhidna lutea TaxID=447679 RepID=A0A239LCH7_EKHLU|nr:hypothetical protein [Ekhidna lutea]SNT28000.1 hypothetical protein SAMN05421640_3142 [Ekhidna lutea]